MSNNKYDNSAPLDVHRWSDYPEVNTFVDQIHADHFADYHKPIMKKHLKVVLLDLYVRWREDPTMYVAVSMSRSGYKAKTRYNTLNISSKTIDVIKRLVREELITFKKGWKDPEGRSFRSRIRATGKLIDQFNEVTFSVFHIGDHKRRETIILRNKNKQDIEYKDTHSINWMRYNLNNYNDLLRRTFVDIPSVEEPIIDVGKDGKSKLVRISSHDKFVRRVFNNSNWQQGGRFYGGWWQRISSERRSEITIDDQPTLEDDFSSLHIALLYAMEGIDYYAEYHEDPYAVPVREINDPEESRKLVKLLFLTAINAEDENSTFGAIRKSYPRGHRIKQFKNNQFREILEQLKGKHPQIADKLCSGAGIDLMNVDGNISEYVINYFTEREIPILCVHDSYIVPFKEGEQLRNTMVKAIAAVTKKITEPMIDRKGISYQQLINHGRMDNDPSQQRLTSVAKFKRTEEYKQRLADHNAFIESLNA